EAVTTMVKFGVNSYRQLPVTLYQIRTKFRDEIRPRFGLMRGREFTVVQADSGAIGGRDSEEFMVLADTGEDAVVRCASCGYGANVEKAETGRRTSPWEEETAVRMEDVSTPGKGSIEEVVEFLGITPSRMIKCLVYETEKGYAVALLRGDLDVNEITLQRALGVEHL